MKQWEIKLTEEEVEIFEEILSDLRKDLMATCPYSIHTLNRGNTLSQAHSSGYCFKMCGNLFPSLVVMFRKRDIRTLPCPCLNISTSYKVKIVSKLLKYNR